MNTFTDNQVTHLYVGTSLADPTASGATTGSIYFKADTQSNDIWMLFKSKKGDVERTDIIDKKKIMWATATKASVMRRYAAQSTLKVNTAVVGQTYIIDLRFDHYMGMSDEDIAYKVGEYTAKSDDTVSTIAAGLAASLQANLGIGLTTTVNSLDKNLVTVSVSDDTITVTEKFQPWYRGTQQIVPVYFNLVAGEITNSGVTDNSWATVTNGLKSTTSYITNLYDIADMEYFYMGERGDKYRMNGWPNIIRTDYLVEAADGDPSDTTEYDVLQIHYYYDGSNEQVQRSEKDLIIVCNGKQTTTSASKFGDIMETVLGTGTNSFATISGATITKKLS